MSLIESLYGCGSKSENVLTPIWWRVGGIFIDGEWRAVRGDHGVILGWPSMEGVAEYLIEKGDRVRRWSH